MTLEDMNSFKQKNIDNLTSLWRLAGTSGGLYITQEAFSYCQVPGSEWPNRAWFTQEPKEESIKAVADIVKNSSVPLSVSYWSDFRKNLHPVFGQAGFSVKSEQIGMSLQLEKTFEELNRLALKKVTGTDQADVWAALYPRCFGYVISAGIIDKIRKDTQVFLVCRNQQPIGTVIVHETEDQTGIHGLGIIPECRKLGFAEEVMAIVLNRAIAGNKKLATLQSSAMGLNIYKKMGFVEAFLMTNYQFK